jgi:NADH dehydrogenase
VILGGGFAGLAAALELRADRFEVVLVDRRRCFEFLPNIHELLSGVKSPELLRLPLDVAMKRAGHRFVRDTVTGIDPVEGLVAMKRRKKPLAYDALIFAFGGIDATRGVPGVVEHALPFKSVDECARIGSKLRKLAGRRRGGDVVIVGGGLEGVEALGEILRAHRDDPIRVAMVEARERMLPEAPPSIDAHIRKLCAAHDVTFCMGAPVERIEAASVVLRGGRTLPSDLTIWTGGPAPSPLLAEAGLAPPGSWAPVQPTLQSADHPTVFIAGDSAELPDRLAKQGYHALDMGVHAARNVARRFEGKRLRPFVPSGKPALVSFGDLTCFLITDGSVWAGPALGAAKEAVFELVMAQLDTQPVWQRVPRAIARADRAVRRLLWPSASSLSTLLAQGRIASL